MSKIIKCLELVLGLCVLLKGQAQAVVDLYPSSVQSLRKEKTVLGVSGERLITNVSEPTLAIYKPASPNGTSIVLAPGGDFHVLALQADGIQVADELTKLGITVFILKYTLVPTSTINPLKEFVDNVTSKDTAIVQCLSAVAKSAIEDALVAVSYVRSNADKYGLDKRKIGLMGFSAGGVVSLAAAGWSTSCLEHPDFVVSVFPDTWFSIKLQSPMKETQLFAVMSINTSSSHEDDFFELYKQWTLKGYSTQIIFSKSAGNTYDISSREIFSESWGKQLQSWLSER